MTELPIAAPAPLGRPSEPGQRTGYRVQLPVFEGPLDLLLHLIERDELEITRISLARVTDQYMQYLATLEELEVDDLSDFILVAARLLLIKSQALLPRPPAPQMPSDEDTADELVRQLLIYKQFKKAAEFLQSRQEQGKRCYVRLAPAPRLETGIEHLEPVSLEALLAAAWRAMLAPDAAPPVNNAIAPFAITIHDQIQLITQALIQKLHISFTHLLTHAYTRQEVAITFLAVLELIKQQCVQARQDRMFGEILILPLPAS